MSAPERTRSPETVRRRLLELRKRLGEPGPYGRPVAVTQYVVAADPQPARDQPGPVITRLMTPAERHHYLGEPQFEEAPRVALAEPCPAFAVETAVALIAANPGWNAADLAGHFGLTISQLYRQMKAANTKLAAIRTCAGVAMPGTPRVRRSGTEPPAREPAPSRPATLHLMHAVMTLRQFVEAAPGLAVLFGLDAPLDVQLRPVETTRVGGTAGTSPSDASWRTGRRK